MFPNPIKYDVSLIPNTIGQGNMYLDIDGYAYGDTPTTGWWMGYSPLVDGYTIYINKASDGPSIYSPYGDNELVATVKGIAASVNDDPSNIDRPEDALVYLSKKIDMICINIDYPPLVTEGMIFLLDAGFTASYPRAGDAWFDLVPGNANPGELINSSEFKPDDNGSLVFNGSNQFVIVNSNSDILPKTAYTKIVWFYARTFGAPNNLISGGISGEHAFWLFSSDRLSAGHNGNWNTVSGTTQLDINTWYCGAVTFDSAVGWKLYLNGNVESSSSNRTQFRGDGDVNIAAYQGGNLFNGQIAFASVYNRALSDVEILNNYNSMSPRFAGGFDLMFEDGSIMETESGDLVEYEH
jgi:hypothetical protein